MMGILSVPRLIIACSDGNIFLYARSPVAPKKTSALHGSSLTGVPSLLQRFLLMTAESQTHRRQKLPLKIRVASGAESFVERCGQYRRGHTRVDRGLDRPASLPGVGYVARESLQPRVGYQCGGREIEQPGGDDAAPAPNFGDLRQRDLVLIVLGIAQRRRFRIDRDSLFAGIGRSQHTESLGVRRHDAVLDTVVNHLDEVPRTTRAAVQIAALRRAIAQPLEIRRAR